MHIDHLSLTFCKKLYCRVLSYMLAWLRESSPHHPSTHGLRAPAVLTGTRNSCSKEELQDDEARHHNVFDDDSAANISDCRSFVVCASYTLLYRVTQLGLAIAGRSILRKRSLPEVYQLLLKTRAIDSKTVKLYRWKIGYCLVRGFLVPWVILKDRSWMCSSGDKA